MTTPSIKEALKPCPFCGCTDICSVPSLNFICCRGCHVTFEDAEPSAIRAWNTRATLQPDGERREAIARIIDPMFRDALALSLNAKRTEQALAKADTILASGLVQDEAAIRADEREKCAEIADLRYEPVATEIATAIRSARDGSAES